MTMDSHNICRDCDWSVPIEHDPDGYLECRRHSIQIAGIDSDGTLVSAFPVTEETAWCGDFDCFEP